MGVEDCGARSEITEAEMFNRERTAIRFPRLDDAVEGLWSSFVGNNDSDPRVVRIIKNEQGKMAIPLTIDEALTMSDETTDTVSYYGFNMVLSEVAQEIIQRARREAELIGTVEAMVAYIEWLKNNQDVVQGDFLPERQPEPTTENLVNHEGSQRDWQRAA